MELTDALVALLSRKNTVYDLANPTPVQFYSVSVMFFSALLICLGNRSMTASFYYYDQNPSGFCFLVQIRAFSLEFYTTPEPVPLTR